GNAEFLALDSNYMDPQQLNWITQRLGSANSARQVRFFPHPLYSDGSFHGPDKDLRARLEPIFEEHGVSVVFSGHDHVYERIKPQKGINYFVVGNSGQLRYHNLTRSADMAKGFDTDQTFMIIEIDGDQFYFQTVSRAGETVDSGVLEKESKASSK